MLAFIRSTRTFSTGGFLVEAASFLFVFVILFSFSVRPGIIASLVKWPAGSGAGPGRKKTKRRGCARRGQPFFYLARSAHVHRGQGWRLNSQRSEEHTSELQSLRHL